MSVAQPGLHNRLHPDFTSTTCKVATCGAAGRLAAGEGEMEQLPRTAGLTAGGGEDANSRAVRHQHSG